MCRSCITWAIERTFITFVEESKFDLIPTGGAVSGNQASPHSGHLCRNILCRNIFICLELDILCVVAYLSGCIFRLSFWEENLFFSNRCSSKFLKWLFLTQKMRKIFVEIDWLVSNKSKSRNWPWVWNA